MHRKYYNVLLTSFIAIYCMITSVCRVQNFWTRIRFIRHLLDPDPIRTETLTLRLIIDVKLATTKASTTDLDKL